MDIRLYSYFRSSAAYRVRIALNLKGVPYQIRPVHLVHNGGEQHGSAYRSINPQGLVPCLEWTDSRGRNQHLSQSTAICEYLEEKYPQPQLLPADIVARAQVRSLMQVIACDLHPLNNLRVLRYLEEQQELSKQDKMDWYFHWLDEGFKAIEARLHKNLSEDYCFGNEVTLADAFLIPQVYNALRFKFDMEPFEKIVQVYQHCTSLKAFRIAAPENQPDAE